MYDCLCQINSDIAGTSMLIRSNRSRVMVMPPDPDVVSMAKAEAGMDSGCLPTEMPDYAT